MLLSKHLWHHTQVCEKDGYHMSWVVKLVQQISQVFSTQSEQFCFIQQVEKMFSDIIREFFEFSLTGEHCLILVLNDTSFGIET